MWHLSENKLHLTDNARIWPVHVDPNIAVSGSGTAKTIQDAPIYNNKPNTTYGGSGNNFAVVGCQGSNGVGRTLMKFPGLATNSTYKGLSASQITNLSLHLYEGSGLSTTACMDLWQYTGTSWNETTAQCSNIGWNSYSNNFTWNFINCSSWQTFNMTSMVATWKSNSTALDKGIMLTNYTSESSLSHRKDFMTTESGNQPYLSYTYNTNVPVSQVCLSPTSLTLNVNSTYYLSGSVLPSNATNKTINWTSSNNSVATVSSSGMVCASSPGTVTITAKSAADSTKYATCSVTVIVPTKSIVDLETTLNWTPTSAIAKGYSLAGFLYNPSEDTVYSKRYAWQRTFGFCDWFDQMCGTMFYVHDEVFNFNYGSDEWRIELWKGQYGLKNGAEIGLYYRKSSGIYSIQDAAVYAFSGGSDNKWYESVSENDLLYLDFTLYRNGTQFINKGATKHWWLTGFKWGVLTDPANMYMDAGITFPTTAFANAFKSALNSKQYTYGTNSAHGGTRVSFRFNTPKGPQHLDRTVYNDSTGLVNAYNRVKVQYFPNTNNPNAMPARASIASGFLNDYDKIANYSGNTAKRIFMEIF